MCLIAQRLKKETVVISSVIALVSVLEFFAICFQIFLSIIFKESKFVYISVFSLVVYIAINIFVYLYVKNNVISADAIKEEKLSKKKMKGIDD